MQFDKPKVTIDLEEYQYLKEQEGKLEVDDWYNVAMEYASFRNAFIIR